jgi:myosin-5
VDPDGYQIGRTKIFLRPGMLAFVEEVWARKQEAALRLQTFWRMRGPRRAFLSMQRAAVTAQSAWRSIVALRQLRQRRLEWYSAVKIQAVVRRRQQEVRWVAPVVVLGMAVWGHLGCPLSAP